MAGSCPDGAVSCVSGPKWSVNDPIFFMHHAVRVTSASRFAKSPSSHRIMAAQMVDKIWYDWQNKDPRNKYAYGGGSIETSGTNFTTFPTGYPPYLNVSASSGLRNIHDLCVSYASFAPQFDSQIPGDGISSSATVWDVIDTTGGPLCYVYA